MKSQRIKLGLLVLLIAGALIGVKIVGLAAINVWLVEFTGYVRSLGWLGIFLYAVVFGISSLLAIPAMPLTIAAGVIFGFGLGVGTTMLGIALGAAMGFLVSRYLARDTVAEKLKNSPKFKAIDTAVGNEGWKIVALLRLCPFPFGLSNYLYGITAIKFWHYLAASVAGCLPGVCFFVYLGAAGQSGLVSASNRDPKLMLPMALGLLAGITCLLFVGKVARRAVARATIETPLPPPEIAEITPAPDLR